MSNGAINPRISFGLRHLFAIVATFALILGAWHWLLRWPRVTITGADIRRDRVIEIETDGLPHYLEVRIFGEIDGQATITDPWGNTTSVGPGEFDLSVANEYYDGRATIKYSPTTVTSGNISVQYNFVGS